MNSLELQVLTGKCKSISPQSNKRTEQEFVYEKIVNVGFIGVGNFVTGNHLPNVKANPGLHIRALCDLNEDLLAQRQKEFGGDYVTTDADKVFNDPTVDFVIRGTQHDQHDTLSIRAAQAGRDVFCEKPMAHTLEQMGEVIRVMRQTGRRYMVATTGTSRRPYRPKKSSLASRPLMALWIVGNAELGAPGRGFLNMAVNTERMLPCF